MLNRELGDRWGTAWALHRLSVTLSWLAEFGRQDISSVRPLIDEGLALWRELGERRHFAFAVCDLGVASILEHDFEHAHRWLLESHSMFVELGEPHGVRWVLTAQQFLLATAGYLEPALRLLSRAHDSCAISIIAPSRPGRQLTQSPATGPPERQ